MYTGHLRSRRSVPNGGTRETMQPGLTLPGRGAQMQGMNDEILLKPHDLGGLPAGPVDREEHELSWWEQRIDAMLGLCFAKGLISDVAQLRDAIENLGPEIYENLNYYERWAAAMASLLIEADVVSRDELDARIDDLRAGSETPS
jgi:hypothetical protein